MIYVRKILSLVLAYTLNIWNIYLYIYISKVNFHKNQGHGLILHGNTWLSKRTNFYDFNMMGVKLTHQGPLVISRKGIEVGRIEKQARKINV